MVDLTYMVQERLWLMYGEQNDTRCAGVEQGSR